MDGRSGYTMVELLVVVVVLSILVLIGLASYRGFADRQQVVQAAQDVVTQLRLVQKMADAGEHSGDCPGSETLVSYTVTFNGTNSNVSYNCSGGTSQSLGPLNLKNNLGVSVASIVFKTVSGGVDSAVDIILNVGSGSNVKQVKVTPGGAISIE